MNYIDVLTIGELSADIMKVLKPLREEFNIVSVRTDNRETRNVAELEAHADLVIRQEDDEPECIVKKESGVEVVVSSCFLASYIRGVVSSVHTNKAIVVSLTADKTNIEYLPRTIESIKNGSIVPEEILVNLSEEEFPEREKEFSMDVLNSIAQEGVVVTWMNPCIKLLGVVPTMQYMEDSYIIWTTPGTIFGSNSIRKAVKIAECLPGAYVTEDIELSIFGTKVASPRFTLVTSDMVTDMLWKGASEELKENSPEEWWLSFNIWYAGKSVGAYTSKFEIRSLEKISLEKSPFEISEFYHNMARMGIKKLVNKY